MEKLCIVKRRKASYENVAPSQVGADDHSRPDTLMIELTPRQMQSIRSNGHFQHLYGEDPAPIFLNVHFEGTFPSRMLKSQELCDMLQVSKHTLARLTKTGAIRSHRIGRLRRFSAQDVMEYLSNGFEEHGSTRVYINTLANSEDK